MVVDEHAVDGQDGVAAVELRVIGQRAGGDAVEQHAALVTVDGPYDTGQWVAKSVTQGSLQNYYILFRFTGSLIAMKATSSVISCPEHRL